MRSRSFFAAKSLASAFAFCFFLFHASAAPKGAEPRTAAEFAAAADPNDPLVGRIAAEKIQEWNYLQHPFDAEMSGKFLDHFIDSLDYFHLFFVQGDINDFQQYRSRLNIMTLKEQDLTPCWVIFSRFMERVHQRYDLASNMLATAQFEFTNHERFALNRHALPYAKDLDQAKDFWRQELRCEYLDQLLNSPDVQFVGPVTLDSKGNAVVTLKRDKIHPASFDLLPTNLVVELADGGSDATVHFNFPIPENVKKTTNHLAMNGKEIGDVTFHHEKLETALTNLTVSSATNTDMLYSPTGGQANAAAATQPNASATNSEEKSTNLIAMIHLNEKNLAEIHKTLTNRYDQMMRNYHELDSDRVFEWYINSLARAYDPHSDFMGHVTAENFGIQMKLSLFGIGALLGKDSDYCKIVELKEGPAKRSGKIRENDRIVAVAQSNAEPVEVEGMTLDKIVEMIRGPKGSQVTLTVTPADAIDASVRKQVTLVRDEIKLEEQESKARLYENTNTPGSAARIGVINIPSFYANPEAGKSMAGDVAKLVRRMKEEKVGGIILDLRHNGGGYLEEAVSLSGLFVPKGPIVQTKEPSGDCSTDSSSKSPIYDGPLIVLTSRLSASASEIMAGAMQDYDRALIVGDHSTFGKGTVQTMQGLQPYLIQFQRRNNLPYDTAYDPGELKLTIKKFYRAGGSSTQLKGVLSDIELPSRLNADTNDIGESALPEAMPFDEVTSADPINMHRVRPYLPTLLERSKQRVAASKDYQYIRDDIAEFLKMQADKTVSLNLADRQAEQKTNAARAEAIKREIASRKKPEEKIYDLTLKNVDLAQLEPMAVKTNSATASASSAFSDDEDLDAEVAAEGPVDPALDEARHIMTDYIALLNKQPLISQTP